MQNKLLSMIRQYDMLSPGDTVICAVSGGADSVALLFALYLLKDRLGIRLEAAHFNHRLRGQESDEDEAFVRGLCSQYDIPLHVGTGEVKAGKKGLEAAARDARYGFLLSLDGKIATAHTADDNAETVLMRLIRGTGLKGLGAIAPVSGRVIRPMLLTNRQEVEDFLAVWGLPHREDSSNASDAFLRNRLRHDVMPLLKAENPRLAENLSRMALRLRQDEDFLRQQADWDSLPGVEALKIMPEAIRSRCIEAFLKQNGVPEPEDSHISAVEDILYSDRPSARVNLPGGVTVTRQYDRLEAENGEPVPEPAVVPCPGEVLYGDYRVTCAPAGEVINTLDTFTVCPVGQVILRPRKSGDVIRLKGGTKSLKKLFIDRKIPAARREQIPVVCDELGVLGVYSIGVHVDRAAGEKPGVTIHFEKYRA